MLNKKIIFEGIVLNRQKTLLYILSYANKPLEKIVLTKFAFLLKNECKSQGGSAFYDFVPYKYGPFSFNIYHELNKLEKEGFISFLDANRIVLNSNKRSDIPAISSDIHSDIVALKRKYSFEKSTLLEHVYNEYFWFTINSKIEKKQKRPKGNIAIYTAGYEGQQVDKFLDNLLRNGIQRLIDVRYNPVARRYGYHKSTLKRLCEKLEIEYIHIPEVGIQGELRQNLISLNDYISLFNRYRDSILSNNSKSVLRISSLLYEKPSVLVCQEADHHYCHRSVLADELKKITDLKIKHICGETCNQSQSGLRF